MIRFDEFLEEVLYKPNEGYYFKKRIGEDFYTSLSFEKLFTYTFANYFIKTGFNNIIEIGSNQGYFKSEVIEFYKNKGLGIQYYEIERIKESSKIGDFENFEGIIFQNELLDAIEFRRFKFKKNKWYEIYVKNYKEMIELELNDNGIIEILPENPYEDLIYDVSIKALELLKAEYEILKRGLIIIVDYGYERNEILIKFPNGSLTCYYKHTVSNDPFEHLYEQDITYFLDWTLIKKIMEKLGAKLILDKSQGEFLLEQGILEIAYELTQNSNQIDKFKVFNKVKTLVLDFYNFRVLVYEVRKD
jgi:SAM-dependent MidA family methyltransferase